MGERRTGARRRHSATPRPVCAPPAFARRASTPGPTRSTSTKRALGHGQCRRAGRGAGHGRRRGRPAGSWRSAQPGGVAYSGSARLSRTASVPTPERRLSNLRGAWRHLGACARLFERSAAEHAPLPGSAQLSRPQGALVCVSLSSLPTRRRGSLCAGPSSDGLIEIVVTTVGGAFWKRPRARIGTATCAMTQRL